MLRSNSPLHWLVVGMLWPCLTHAAKPCELYLGTTGVPAPKPITGNLGFEIRLMAKEYPRHHTALLQFVVDADLAQAAAAGVFEARKTEWRQRLAALSLGFQNKLPTQVRAAMIADHSFFRVPHVRRILRENGGQHPELKRLNPAEHSGLRKRLDQMSPRSRVFAAIGAYAIYGTEATESWALEELEDLNQQLGIGLGRVEPMFVASPTMSTLWNHHFGPEPSVADVLRSARRAVITKAYPSSLAANDWPDVQAFCDDLAEARRRWQERVAMRAGQTPAALFPEESTTPPPPASSPPPASRQPSASSSLRPQPAPAPPPAAPPPMDRATYLAESRKLELNPLARAALDHAPAPVPTAEERPGSWDRFTAYFEAAKSTLLERDQLLALTRIAFLTDGSLLMAGPPGEAKSFAADLIGKPIRYAATGRSSFFSLQLTPDTSLAETSGGLIPADAIEGILKRNWRKGALGYAVVFLDEFFDGRLKFLKTFLSAFSTREYTQGAFREKGETRVFFAATNKYINQIYAEADDHDPQAIINNFHTIYYSPGKFEDLRSVLKLSRKLKPQMPDLFFEDIDDLQRVISAVDIAPAQILRTYHIFRAMRSAVRQHEANEMRLFTEREARREARVLPYRATRVFSPQSLEIAFRRIKAAAFARARAAGLDHVVVEDADVDEALATFLPMQGPSDQTLARLREAPHQEPDERAQLETLAFERATYRRVIDELTAVEARDNRSIDIALKAADAGEHRPLLKLVRQVSLRFAEVDRARAVGIEQISGLACLRRIANEVDQRGGRP